MATKIRLLINQPPSDWAGKEIELFQDDITVLFVDHATAQGRPSVTLGVAQGNRVLAMDLTYRLLLQIYDLAHARYGDLDRSDMPFMGVFTPGERGPLRKEGGSRDDSE